MTARPLITVRRIRNDDGSFAAGWKTSCICCRWTRTYSTRHQPFQPMPHAWALRFAVEHAREAHPRPRAVPS